MSSSAQDNLIHKAEKKLAEEARRFLLMFLYLWALLLLFVLNEDIVLRKQGVNITAQGFALLNALVLAKVMLLSEDLDLGRWLPRKPLIFPILQESLLLTMLFIAFHILEHIVIGHFFKHETVAASVPHIGGGGLLGLCLVSAVLFIALLPFFAFKHIGREIGEARLREMLFGPAASKREG